jgi:uncharacterized protein
VVTGASSGIGRAFAESLAARGHPLLLIARREARLRELAATLAGRHGVAARVAVCDLTEEDGLRRARAAIDDAPAPPGVIVLNAGFGSVGAIAELDREIQADMVRLNAVAVVDLAAHVLPGMVARGRGVVIVISSVAARMPLPFMATYAATKAFELSFTRALREELRGTGVRAIAVCPGPTRTGFGAVAGAGSLPGVVPFSSAERVVERTWDGLRRGRGRVDVGPLGHLSALAPLAPAALIARVAGVVHRARVRRAPG